MYKRQKEYNISIGAVNLNDGVNIMLFVDDACIFNYFDNSEDAIKTGGYMNIYGGNEITLSEYDNKNSLTDLPAAVTISGEAKEGETPVSYTHLDVYKRQAYRPRRNSFDRYADAW